MMSLMESFIPVLITTRCISDFLERERHDND